MNSKKYIFLVFSVISFLSISFSQNNITITDETSHDAHPSAMLDVHSTTKGMLVPKMSSGQMNLITDPASGLLIFNTTENSFFFYNGTIWKSITEDVNNDVQFLTRTEIDELTPRAGQLVYNTTNSVIIMWNGTYWLSFDTQCFPQPDAADAGEDQVITDNVLTTSLNANIPSEGTGTWTITSGTGGSFTDENLATTNFTGTACEDYVLKWTISTDCNTSEDIVSIDFDAQPTTADAGEDIVSATIRTVPLAANSVTSGTGTWSIVSGPSGGSFTNNNDPTTNFSAPTGIYTLRWTTTTACHITYDDVIVHFSERYIGENYGGGIVFYIDEDGLHGYVCAENDQSTGTSWGCAGTDITGAEGTILGSGEQNTSDIVTDCATAGIAARICYDLSISPYDDWYLPSSEELEYMYTNLHTQGLGNFSDGIGVNYWSSTENTGVTAVSLEFESGNLGGPIKDVPHRVRAIRPF